MTRRNAMLAGLALLVVALVAGLAYCTRMSIQDSPAPTPVGAATAAATPKSGLPTVTVGELPKEAVATLALIDKNGPFPYDKDGATFANLEKLLPQKARSYYREYTVPTPGSRDRGARRFVTGRDGDIYYTDDHYESFRQVLR